MAYKPKPNYFGSDFYLHDRVMVVRTGKAGIITGYDYNSIIPKHAVTFNYGSSNVYVKGYADEELKLLKRDERVIEGIKRYEEMILNGR